ncbi:hypothetical protein, partial [Mesorhizobium sp.]|uniref:hypothetical protein n=1 Tax=Mesorhizobium sp. TaxID=1871066 RepID=UPI0025C6A9B8
IKLRRDIYMRVPLSLLSLLIRVCQLDEGQLLQVATRYCSLSIRRSSRYRLGDQFCRGSNPSLCEPRKRPAAALIKADNQ